MERYGEEVFRQALAGAELGQLSPRAWNYWHVRLGLEPIPSLPTRAYTAVLCHSEGEAKDYIDIAAMLRAGLSLAEGIGRLDALFPNTINVAMTLQSLVYFSGGDLGTLTAETKATLIDAVRHVREVPQFDGQRVSIGG